MALGLYLQVNGYDTEIFELHSLPGGLCTSWQRKGYTFDGCIHWLCGSSPKTEMNILWRELVDIQDKKIINHESFIHTDIGNGQSFSVYNNTEKLRKELLRIAPEDKKLTDKFINTIDSFKNMNMHVLNEQTSVGLIDGFKFLTSN